MAEFTNEIQCRISVALYYCSTARLVQDKKRSRSVKYVTHKFVKLVLLVYFAIANMDRDQSEQSDSANLRTRKLSDGSQIEVSKGIKNCLFNDQDRTTKTATRCDGNFNKNPTLWFPGGASSNRFHSDKTSSFVPKDFKLPKNADQENAIDLSSPLFKNKQMADALPVQEARVTIKSLVGDASRDTFCSKKTAGGVVREYAELKDAYDESPLDLSASRQIFNEKSTDFSYNQRTKNAFSN